MIKPMMQKPSRPAMELCICWGLAPAVASEGWAEVVAEVLVAKVTLGVVGGTTAVLVVRTEELG